MLLSVCILSLLPLLLLLLLQLLEHNCALTVMINLFGNAKLDYWYRSTCVKFNLLRISKKHLILEKTRTNKILTFLIHIYIHIFQTLTWNNTKLSRFNWMSLKICSLIFIQDYQKRRTNSYFLNNNLTFLPRIISMLGCFCLLITFSKIL